MKLGQGDIRRFAEYEKFWRRVLVDVLGWPERKFARFVSRRKARLRRQGGKRFFDTSPSHFISSEIVPKRFKKKFPGKKAIWIRWGLIEAICGELKLNETNMVKYGIMAAMHLAEYRKVCNPNFDILASRLRYQKQVKELDSAVVRTVQDDQRDFAEYEKFWRRILVDVLEWPKKEFRRFFSRERAELREWGGEDYFRDPPYEYIKRYLLPESLERVIVGLDAINAQDRLLRVIAGCPYPYTAVCEDGFNAPSTRRRYFRAIRQMERKVKRLRAKRSATTRRLT